MRVLPLAFLPKKISSSFLFFIDSNGMMMVYKENNISETKKVERKLPEDFQFPVILRLVSLSSHAIRSHVWKPPFSHKFFKDWKKLWWFRVNKRKTRSSAEVFQSICSRFLSYQKQKMNRGIPLLLISNAVRVVKPEFQNDRIFPVFFFSYDHSVKKQMKFQLCHFFFFCICVFEFSRQKYVILNF